MEENKNLTNAENATETETKVETKVEAKQTDKTKEPSIQELQETILRLEAENKAKDVNYEKLKGHFDRVSSDVSKYKKDLQARMTDEEVQKQELKEKQEAREKEFAEMKRELDINKATKEYLAYGLSEEEAEKCANAQIDGNLDFVLKTLKADKEATVKKEKAEWMNNSPDPQAGGAVNAELDPFLQGFDAGSK